MILQREFYMIHQLKPEGLNHSQIARRLGVPVRRIAQPDQVDRTPPPSPGGNAGACRKLGLNGLKKQSSSFNRHCHRPRFSDPV